MKCLAASGLVSDIAVMSDAPLNIAPSLPEMRHSLRGTHLVDAPVASVEVLLHRQVTLEEWSLRLASNAFWRLYWPVSRGGIVTFNEEKVPLEPGSLYLISPHTAFDSDCTRSFAKWYIHFNVGGLPQSLRPGIVRLQPTEQMQTLLDQACPKRSRAKKADRASGSALDALQLALLAFQLALPELRQSSATDSRISQCVEYLREHLREKVVLADLVRFSGIKSRTLSNLFVSEVGFPPMRYLIELRLNHAMKLLRHTDDSIEKIAEECGFPNRYYFTRMLSRYRRTTPAAFRTLMAES